MLDWSRVTRKPGRKLLVVGILATLVLASLTTARAAAPQAAGNTPDFQRESHGSLDADYRTGSVAVTVRQQQAWPPWARPRPGTPSAPRRR
jgi:hypothetical protein